MAFPEDLDNVAAFKVHPAIGVARLADNDDVYEFFESEIDRANHQYMSLVNGKHVMKRQSVQYRLFAYDANRSFLGELTDEAQEALGIEATWTANVANRKLHNYSIKRGDSPPIPEITASGSAVGEQTTTLIGRNPFDPAESIGLGSISGNGLFVPPRGGVVRKTPSASIPSWPADENYALDVTDTTSDGSIEVALNNTGEIPVVPAWVVVAPQQHGPDVNPGNPDLDSGFNEDWTETTKLQLGVFGDPDETPAYRLDRAMVDTINGEYNPGMETSFQLGRFEHGSVSDVFYQRDVGPIGLSELRIQPSAAGAAPGALPGQLTSGLCSTWQGDLAACLNYWTAEYPPKVQVEGLGKKDLFRKRYQDLGRMDGTENMVAYANRMGVARNLNDDVNDLVETERTPNDDP